MPIKSRTQLSGGCRRSRCLCLGEQRGRFGRQPSKSIARGYIDTVLSCCLYDRVLAGFVETRRTRPKAISARDRSVGPQQDSRLLMDHTAEASRRARVWAQAERHPRGETLVMHC